MVPWDRIWTVKVCTAIYFTLPSTNALAAAAAVVQHSMPE